MERGGILNVASISVGPLNVLCTKKLVQNVRKLRNKQAKQKMEKRSSNFFPHIIYMFFYVSQEDIDTLDSSAHYLSSKFNFFIWHLG